MVYPVMMLVQVQPGPPFMAHMKSDFTARFIHWIIKG